MFPGCCRQASPQTKFDSTSRYLRRQLCASFLSLVIVAGLGFLVGCGGGSSGSTPEGVPRGRRRYRHRFRKHVSPSRLTVGRCRVVIYPDGAFTSVTICNPGTTTCQTIDGILVDTGSFGLRILSSAITLTGLQALTSGNSTLYNCINFADGSFLWGTAAVADVEMAGEKATSETVQVIADPLRNLHHPHQCSVTGSTKTTRRRLGANGILGIGPEPVDCGRGLRSQLATAIFLRSRPPITCALAYLYSYQFVSISQQVVNPVALFPADNNGIIVELPTLSGAAATETGSLIFGIGTKTNNQVPSQRKHICARPGGYLFGYLQEAYLQQGQVTPAVSSTSDRTVCSSPTPLYRHAPT